MASSTGAGTLTRLSYQQLRVRFENVLRKATITIAGNVVEKDAAEAFARATLEQWKDQSPRKSESRAENLKKEAPARVELSRNADEWTHAGFTLRPVSVPLLRELELEVLLGRFLESTDGRVRISNVPVGSLVRLPHLRLDGSHHEVLLALKLLQELSLHLGSPIGRPSEEEFSSARTRLAERQAATWEPRCLTSADRELSRENVNAAVIAHRGDPLTALWGTPHVEDASEENALE